MEYRGAMEIPFRKSTRNNGNANRTNNGFFKVNLYYHFRRPGNHSPYRTLDPLALRLQFSLGLPLSNDRLNNIKKKIKEPGFRNQART